MKIFIKLLLLVLVLGLAGPFFLKKPDGSPWMKADDWIPDTRGFQARIENWWSRAMGSIESLDTEGTLDLPSGKMKVYRWRASDGSWKFSDTPPAGVSEEVWIDPNVNVTQSIPIKPKKVEQKEGDITPANGIPLPLTISPGQVSTLINDAKNVQGLVNQRSQALEAVVSGAAEPDD